MKIIIKDNFDRGNIDDQLVCENVNENYGALIVDLLNKDANPPNQTSSNFFMLVPDNHILFKFYP
jgi:hypothetical protein